MQISKVLTLACLKEEQYRLWSSMCRLQAVSVWNLESLGQQAFLLCLEKRGEKTGQERRGLKKKKNNEMKIVAVVQLTHPEGFDFSNTVES